MRKRSEAGGGSSKEIEPDDARDAGPVLPGEPDPFAGQGKITGGIDFDKFAKEQRERREDGVDAIVEVNLPEDVYQPVQYNSFRHGGFKVAARVRKGETIADAIARVHCELIRAYERTYPDKQNAFLTRLRDLGADVERLRR